MILQDLIAGCGLDVATGGQRAVVTGLSDDSRTVCPGDLFIARRGTVTDGFQYVTQAIDRGAVAVVADRPPSGKLAMDGRSVAWAYSSELSPKSIGQIAERFFDHPSQKLRLVGVTGTNGKTTTATLIQHLLQRAGLRCGLIGTVQIDDGHLCRAASLTTPGPVTFSRTLADMVAHGCQWAVAEISSHSLDQGRVAAIHFDAAVFTNLTGDHLDYHHSMDRYATAKAKLFDTLTPTTVAVVNGDDPNTARVIRDSPAKIIYCSVKNTPVSTPRRAEESWAIVQALTAQSSSARFEGSWGCVEAHLPMVGVHNVANMLQAVTLVSQYVNLSNDLAEIIASCPAVPGRLERVTGAPNEDVAGPVVLVDYAHTHHALENVLTALRTVTSGQLIVMFGCGGDRDRTKRPKMAAVACQWADTVVVTTDNPRTEDPETIIREILEGVPPSARSKVSVEVDRALAIANVIQAAELGDTVLLAGKGHENYQIIGSTKTPFDDRQHAKRVLRQWHTHRSARGSLSPVGVTRAK